jgi:hypothetical protein
MLNSAVAPAAASPAPNTGSVSSTGVPGSPGHLPGWNQPFGQNQ